MTDKKETTTVELSEKEMDEISGGEIDENTKKQIMDRTSWMLHVFPRKNVEGGNSGVF